MSAEHEADEVFEEWFTEHFGSVNIHNAEGRSHLRDAFFHGWNEGITIFAEDLIDKL